MKINSNRMNDQIGKLNESLNQGLVFFSTYFLPIVIGVLSLLAVFSWESQYSTTAPDQVEVKVAVDLSATWGPEQALAELSTKPFRSHFDTNRSESPLWFLFSLGKRTETASQLIELPSRHAIEFACWDAKSMSSLGQGDRNTTQGRLALNKAGFYLALPSSNSIPQILCRTRATGPARISVLAWSEADFRVSDLEFHRKSGLLDGGILVLAAFVLITAAINRNRLYFLFSAWLVVNLRMAANSWGWDTQWLGNTVPQDWLLTIRPLTLATYYVLTVTLFALLFRDDLRKIGHRRLLPALQWVSLPLLVGAIAVPYQNFLPILWASAVAAVVVLIYLLAKILIQTRSRVAIWYSASIGISLLSSFSEVIGAALGLKGLIGSINFVTAALSSSLLAALAIAEHMRQEHEQRLSLQAELEHTYDAMPIGLFTLDLEGRFLSANPALVKMLGPLVLTDAGNTWARHFSLDGWHRLHSMVSGAGQDEMEIKGRKIPGFIDTKRFLVKATLAGGKVEGSLQDVTEKSRATEHLLFLANHDPLTRAYNRRGIETLLTSAIGELRNGKQGMVAAAYLDLDRFKLINDLFGHDAGDEVLRQACSRVGALLTADHSVGRVGGDEFVILFLGVPVSEAASACHRIVESIGTAAYRVGDKAFYVRCSIGLIEVNSEMKFNDVISSADRACREAKTNSVGPVVVYEGNSPAFLKHEAELRLIALLSGPTATDGLHLEMQPIMSLTAPNQSLNFEVLLRMRDPFGQPVRTDLLIQAAEGCGRMSMIDRWVLTTTLEWLEVHFTQMKHTRFVCVNLSGASLNDESFLHDVYALFESKPDLVRYLCLEITESVALHDLANTRRFVDQIRRYGAKIALDDFGTGYTSFSYLKEFTADLLKIDGSFIVNMNQHPANIAIVEAIVSLAKNLGMKVVAEWAEDLATLRTLTEIGVDYVQGFIVARPQHPDQLLNARSSAMFIKDDDVAIYVEQQEKFNPKNTVADIFSTGSEDQFH
jgi:diguanylate cyclase (GGDEF)-like protein